MAHRTSRRRFMQTTAATGIGFWVAGGVQAEDKSSKSPNERIRIAVIGCGGKGASDLKEASNFGDIVALCDVDEKTLESAAKKLIEGDKPAKGAKKGKAAEAPVVAPPAEAKKKIDIQKFFDFREMLDKMHDKIDAVTVSTADHCHAAAAVMAMKLGKHCFVQKPLTHTIYEARMLGQVAREMKVATQMGNQFTANDNLRKTAAAIRGGAVGTVKEIHVWTNRPIWPQGGERPEPSDPPANLKWDLWLGPAPARPYAPGAYHPFRWRGWWDFGTGALGDMACHTFNMPFMALDLRNPTSVVAECSGHNKDSYPARSKIAFEFPATAVRPAVNVFWYDGGNLPSEELLSGVEAVNTAKSNSAPRPGEQGKSGQSAAKPVAMSKSGIIVVGDKGKFYGPGDYCEQKQYYFAGAHDPDAEYKKSPGHVKEWFDAMRGGEPAMSNFPNYAGPLTETILLGNLAVWTADKGQGKKIEWDAVNLKATNAPEVAHIIQTEYRKGYSL